MLHEWHLPHFEFGDYQACTFSHPNNSRKEKSKENEKVEKMRETDEQR